MEMRDEPAPSRRSRVGGEEQLWVGTRGSADNPPGRATIFREENRPLFSIFYFPFSEVLCFVGGGKSGK
jgi:hypothetical protein